jgi:hypothetical protein
MKKAITLFDLLLEDIRVHSSLYDYIDKVIKPPFDYSDLLRWEWSQSISALDKLIHDIVKYGMIEVFLGKRSPTAKYSSFEISLGTYNQMVSSGYPPEYWFEMQVIQKHRYLAFQDPEKIADALSLFWTEPHKWQRISIVMGAPETDVRKQLQNSVLRRNQIVHQGDIDDNTGMRSNIFIADVNDTVRFIDLIGHSIYSLVK